MTVFHPHRPLSVFSAFIILIAHLIMGVCNAAPDQPSSISKQAGSTKPVFLNEFKNAELSQHWKRISPAKLLDEIKSSPYIYSPNYLLVVWVASNSQAEGLGITAGCKIVKTPNRAHGGKLYWVDLQGNPHTSEVKKGKIGESTLPRTSLTSWYAYYGNRNPKWDNMVVAALQSQWQDVRLADAFWAKAIELGYPADYLSNLSGIAIALCREDGARAEAFATAYGPMQDAPRELLQPQIWQMLASNTGNPRWFTKAVGAWEILYPGSTYIQDIKGIADRQTQLAKQSQGKALKPPSELAKTMKRSSIISDYANSARWPGRDSGNSFPVRIFTAAQEAKEKGKAEFPEQSDRIEPEHYRRSWIGPRKRAQDIDVTMTFKVNPLTSPGVAKSNYTREFIIGLVSRDSDGNQSDRGPFPNDSQALSLCFNYGGHYQNRYAKLAAIMPSKAGGARVNIQKNPVAPAVHKPSYVMPAALLGPDEFHTLRLVRVGSQAEAFVNGKRVALVHVPLDLDNLGLAILRSGVEVSVKSIKADVLK